MNPIILDLLKKTLVTGIISGCVYLFFESPVTASSGSEADEPGSEADEPEYESPYNLRSRQRGIEKITHREELQLILLDEETKEENPNLIYPPLKKQN